MAQATIKDIAKKLNISASTVSRALHNHPDISEETKKLVLSMAAELDYNPDSVAQSLRKKKSNIIGVIVPEIKHNFFSSALDGIEEVSYGAGYAILVCKSNESYDREVVNTRVLMSNRVAGFLVSISQNTKNGDHFEMLKKHDIPIVFFDRVYETCEASKVVADDYGGAFKAVSYLISAGYKRIAHLAGPGEISIGRNRFMGYFDALKKHGVPFDENLVVYGGFNEGDGIVGFRKLLRLNPMPDAIFAVNDPVAIGAFIQIKEKGLKIPDDIALVGFSNNPISALIDPPLTTVHQPSYEIGRTAARLLLEEIKNHRKEIHHETIVLKTKLIIRKST